MRGSGRTHRMLLRAMEDAEKYPDARVMVLTHNELMVRYCRDMVRDLCGTAGKEVPKNLVFQNIGHEGFADRHRGTSLVAIHEDHAVNEFIGRLHISEASRVIEGIESLHCQIRPQPQQEGKK